VNPLYKKILLPTDGSEFANKAAEHAIWIAGASGAEIIALNVIETSSLVGLPAEDLIVRIKDMLKEEGRLIYQDYPNDWQHYFPGNEILNLLNLL